MAGAGPVGHAGRQVVVDRQLVAAPPGAGQQHVGHPGRERHQAGRGHAVAHAVEVEIALADQDRDQFVVEDQPVADADLADQAMGDVELGRDLAHRQAVVPALVDRLRRRHRRMPPRQVAVGRVGIRTRQAEATLHGRHVPDADGRCQSALSAGPGDGSRAGCCRSSA